MYSSKSVTFNLRPACKFFTTSYQLKNIKSYFLFYANEINIATRKILSVSENGPQFKKS